MSTPKFTARTARLSHSGSRVNLVNLCEPGVFEADGSAGSAEPKRSVTHFFIHPDGTREQTRDDEQLWGRRPRRVHKVQRRRG